MPRRNRSITVYQAFPDKKQPPFKATIMGGTPNYWIIQFRNDNNQLVIRNANKGACQTIKDPFNEK